jgi:hypothetical protein
MAIVASEGAAAADELALAAFTRRESPAHRLLRVAIVAAGAALMIAAAAAAANPAPPPAPASEPPAARTAQPGAPDFSAQIAARLSPLVPPGMRLGAVTLACKPPDDAVLKSVAPGVSQLESRGIVVEFTARGRTLACGATVAAERQVLIAAHSIAPGRPVSKDDFSPKRSRAPQERFPAFRSPGPIKPSPTCRLASRSMRPNWRVRSPYIRAIW